MHSRCWLRCFRQRVTRSGTSRLTGNPFPCTPFPSAATTYASALHDAKSHSRFTKSLQVISGHVEGDVRKLAADFGVGRRIQVDQRELRRELITSPTKHCVVFDHVLYFLCSCNQEFLNDVHRSAGFNWTFSRSDLFGNTTHINDVLFIEVRCLLTRSL